MVSHGLGLSFVGFRLYKALDELGRRGLFPEGPCTQIVYTLAPMYLYREHFKAEAYAVWVQGPLGLGNWETLLRRLLPRRWELSGNVKPVRMPTS